MLTAPIVSTNCVELEVRVRVADRRLDAIGGIGDPRELDALAARLAGVLEHNCGRASVGISRADELVLDVDREHGDLVALRVADRAAQPDLEVGRGLRLERLVEAAERRPGRLNSVVVGVSKALEYVV